MLALIAMSTSYDKIAYIIGPTTRKGDNMINVALAPRNYLMAVVALLVLSLILKLNFLLGKASPIQSSPFMIVHPVLIGMALAVLSQSLFVVFGMRFSVDLLTCQILAAKLTIIRFPSCIGAHFTSALQQVAITATPVEVFKGRWKVLFALSATFLFGCLDGQVISQCLKIKCALGKVFRYNAIHSFDRSDLGLGMQGGNDTLYAAKLTPPLYHESAPQATSCPFLVLKNKEVFACDSMNWVG